MRIVGLTGSIGSGKSTVADYWRSLGAAIIDADLLAREAVKPGSQGLKQVVDCFGQEILKGDSLDRKKLGKLIFDKPELRKKLEDILHPEVYRLHLIEIARLKKTKTPLIVAVIPLLFESKSDYSHLSPRILVTAAKADCIARITKRDDISSLDAEKRLNAQMSDQDKRKLADIIIENNGTLPELEAKANAIYLDLIR